MASPFLAITLDAKRRIARAASALGADVATWTLGYLNLLEHVWERKDARITSLVVAACFGPDPRTPGALVEFGFLVVAGDVWDLNHEDADRLLLTHKQRVAAGKARAGGALRTRGAFASAPPAEHQHTTSGAPAGNQLLHPAPSTQHREEETLSAGADLFTDDPRKPTFGPSDLQALWNERAGKAGWPKWASMESREEAARARLKAHPERSWWESVLTKAAQVAFLRGENRDGWRLNPDFLLRKGSAVKILEGKYDGGHGGKVGTTTPERKVTVL